jgi:predicted unusual protein kinase regulating ubiquinone biosynthesis (AarF/ABC1/UbiB family)
VPTFFYGKVLEHRYTDYIKMRWLDWSIYYFCTWCGPMANKLGQLLSARKDFLSIELVDKLEELQSQCVFDVRKDIDVRKIPSGVSDLSFDAIKAGTICVVLHCKYKGQPAILKMVKSGIEQQLKESYRKMMSGLWLFKWFDKCNTYQRMADIQESFLAQTDLRKEAEHQQTWFDLYNSNKAGVPKIYIATKDAICMEAIDNKDIGDMSEEAQQAHAVELYRVIHKAIYIDGLLHADLHPGNVLFDGNRFVFVDFGWCVDIDADKRTQNLAFGLALSSGNYSNLAKIICKLYFSRPNDAVLAEELAGELKKAKMCEDQYATAALSKVLGPFCLKNGLTLNTASSVTEAAMANVDGLLPYFLPKATVSEARKTALAALFQDFRVEALQALRGAQEMIEKL